MRQWVIAALAAGLALAGCSIRDLDFGLSGGVAAEKMTADVFRIRSRADSMTPQDVLLIAAQTAKGAGATHFKLISADDASRQLDGTPLDVNPSAVGRPAISTATPPTTSTSIKPGQDVYIRVLRLAPGEQAPGGSFAADEIIELVGRRAKRG